MTFTKIQVASVCTTLKGHVMYGSGSTLSYIMHHNNTVRNFYALSSNISCSYFTRCTVAKLKLTSGKITFWLQINLAVGRTIALKKFLSWYEKSCKAHCHARNDEILSLFVHSLDGFDILCMCSIIQTKEKVVLYLKMEDFHQHWNENTCDSNNLKITNNLRFLSFICNIISCNM